MCMREVIADVPFCRRKSVESRWSLWFRVRTLTCGCWCGAPSPGAAAALLRLPFMAWTGAGAAAAVGGAARTWAWGSWVTTASSLTPILKKLVNFGGSARPHSWQRQFVTAGRVHLSHGEGRGGACLFAL